MAYTFNDGILALKCDPVPMVRFADPEDFWFKANPIHTFLGAKNITQTLTRVHQDDKASLKDLVEAKGLPLGGLTFDVTPLHEDHNEGKAIYVNESGLYVIILGSKKPEAQAFQRWVTHEVLPAIRKTGYYGKRSSVEESEQPAKRQHLEFETTMTALAGIQTAIEQQSVAITGLRSAIVSDIMLRWGQRLMDFRDTILGAVTSPTGAMITALRGAVKLPPRRTTTNEARFPRPNWPQGRIWSIPCTSTRPSLGNWSRPTQPQWV